MEAFADNHLVDRGLSEKARLLGDPLIVEEFGESSWGIPKETPLAKILVRKPAWDWSFFSDQQAFAFSDQPIK